MKFGTNKVKSKHIQQVGTQKLGHGYAQRPYSPGCNTQGASQPIKCVRPMTFSQKIYQANTLNLKAQEIAEQNYEQALTELNSLETIKNLLDKIVELAD